MEELNAVLPEGLPLGMVKEFEESKRTSLLVRRSFLDLRDNFRRTVDPHLQSFDAKDSKVQKQIVLDGPVSCGKSIALAMLVKWARDEGWLVFYVPNGREWTHGGVFYKNPQTGFWDTPVQASNALQGSIVEACTEYQVCICSKEINNYDLRHLISISMVHTSWKPLSRLERMNIWMKDAFFGGLPNL